MTIQSLGFVGTGTITRAIVTGLCTAPDPSSAIWVSPRSLQIAQDLAASYAQVHVASSNQEVLDRTDAVVLAVLPKDARTVIESLKFRESQRVISVIAGLPHESLESLIKPATHCVRAVPLPSVARHGGPIAIFPPDPETSELFAKIGEPVEVADQGQFEALWACTAEMASYYQLLATLTDFLVGKGLPDDRANKYIRALFGALGTTAIAAHNRPLGSLSKDHTTPGGLNHQMMSELTDAGVFSAHAQSLENILLRLRQSHRGSTLDRPGRTDV